MAHDNRFRSGDTDPISLAPASATVIEVGDLCFLDPVTNLPENAGIMLDQGSLALNQDAFQQYFLGVAVTGSAAGETAKVTFATRGRFEFACASAAFLQGATIGAVETSAGTALEDQKVVGVSGASKAFARVTKAELVAVTKVEVEIVSTIQHGGLQTQTAGSSSGPV